MCTNERIQRAWRRIEPFMNNLLAHSGTKRYSIEAANWIIGTSLNWQQEHGGFGRPLCDRCAFHPVAYPLHRELVPVLTSFATASGSQPSSTDHAINQWWWPCAAFSAGGSRQIMPSWVASWMWAPICTVLAAITASEIVLIVCNTTGRCARIISREVKTCPSWSVISNSSKPPHSHNHSECIRSKHCQPAPIGTRSLRFKGQLVLAPYEQVLRISRSLEWTDGSRTKQKALPPRKSLATWTPSRRCSVLTPANSRWPTIVSLAAAWCVTRTAFPLISIPP